MFILTPTCINKPMECIFFFLILQKKTNLNLNFELETGVDSMKARLNLIDDCFHLGEKFELKISVACNCFLLFINA